MSRLRLPQAPQGPAQPPAPAPAENQELCRTVAWAGQADAWDVLPARLEVDDAGFVKASPAFDITEVAGTEEGAPRPRALADQLVRDHFGPYAVVRGRSEAYHPAIVPALIRRFGARRRNASGRLTEQNEAAVAFARTKAMELDGRMLDRIRSGARRRNADPEWTKIGDRVGSTGLVDVDVACTLLGTTLGAFWTVPANLDVARTMPEPDEASGYRLVVPAYVEAVAKWRFAERDSALDVLYPDPENEARRASADIDGTDSGTNYDNGAPDAVPIPDLLDDHGNPLLKIRASDGYVYVTDICNAAAGAPKEFRRWIRIQDNRDFLQALSARKGIPVDELVKSGARSQGTWVHFMVAIKVAGWCKPAWEVVLMDVLARYMTGQVTAEESRAAAAAMARTVGVVGGRIEDGGAGVSHSRSLRRRLCHIEGIHA